MKVFIFTLMVIFLVVSCTSKKVKNKQPQEAVLVYSSYDNDTLKNHLSKNLNPIIIAKDTMLTFSIEGLSSEGSEVKAQYINDTIKVAIWNIYGETGQSIIQYHFLKDGKIDVVEKNYKYKTSLTKVNSKNDIELKSTLRYLLSTEGSPLTKIKDKSFVNVFTDFKKNVPLILSNLPNPR